MQFSLFCYRAKARDRHGAERNGGAVLQVYMEENHLEIYPGAPEIFFFCNFEYVYGKTSWKYTEIHLKSLKNYILLGKNGQIGYILMGFICIWNLDTGFLESRYLEA